MLAALPSVVLGLWGILVLGPFVQNTLEPFLGSFLGWTPFFSGAHHTGGLLPAMIVLTIMIVPISSAVCRELFLTVPTELKEGAFGLGLTRWEMVRGVILPYTRGGVVAAILLGLGRALGEAIAVTQVIGNHERDPHLVRSHFGRHAREPDRGASTRGRLHQLATRRSSTGADPPDLRADRERIGADHRQALRAEAEAAEMSAVPSRAALARRPGGVRSASASTGPSRSSRSSPRRSRSRVLGLVIGSVLVKALPALNLGPVHQDPGDVRRGRRRDRERVRRLDACSSAWRRRWRCRSAC